MTQTTSIFRVAIFTPLRRLFDYLPPKDIDLDKISIGARVRIPFGKREVIGILVEIGPSSKIPLEQLKAILEIIL